MGKGARKDKTKGTNHEYLPYIIHESKFLSNLV